MFTHLFVHVIIYIVATITVAKAKTKESCPFDKEIEDWHRRLEKELEPYERKYTQAQYQRILNCSKETDDNVKIAKFELQSARAELVDNATALINGTLLCNATLQRSLDAVYEDYLTESSFSHEEQAELLSLVENQKYILERTQICPIDLPECSPKEALYLQPDLVDIFSSSRNETVLLYVWTTWYDKVGSAIRPLFLKTLPYYEKVAEHVNLDSYDQVLLSSYTKDYPDIKEALATSYQKILPLYEELHAHVRRQLSTVYPGHIHVNSTIPSHLQGDILGANWRNIEDIIIAKAEVNITNLLKKKDLNVVDFFKTTEKFFLSLGFPKLPQAFWEKSSFSSPRNQQNCSSLCEPQSWRLSKDDYALTMCMESTSESFEAAYMEMAHVYYSYAFRDQPLSFQEPVNKAFKKAFAYLILISVIHPTYLKSIGLLDKYQPTEATTITVLQEIALEMVPPIPWSFSMDMWRWGIYNKSVHTDTMNQEWWRIRIQNTGVAPPVKRTEAQLDAAAVPHIAGHESNVDTSLSRIMAFQMHEAFCTKSGKPLHQCIIYEDKKVGKKLWKALSYGSSKPWPEILQMLTGSKELSIQPMLDYFKPLSDWLKKENDKSNTCRGWGVEWPEEYKLHTSRCL